MQKASRPMPCRAYNFSPIQLVAAILEGGVVATQSTAIGVLKAKLDPIVKN